jgi:hypothetical protein
MPLGTDMTLFRGGLISYIRKHPAECSIAFDTLCSDGHTTDRETLGGAADSPDVIRITKRRFQQRAKMLKRDLLCTLPFLA